MILSVAFVRTSEDLEIDRSATQRLERCKYSIDLPTVKRRPQPIRRKENGRKNTKSIQRDSSRDRRMENRMLSSFSMVSSEYCMDC